MTMLLHHDSFALRCCRSAATRPTCNVMFLPMFLVSLLIVLLFSAAVKSFACRSLALAWAANARNYTITCGKINTLNHRIVNAAECEPYLSCDNRLMIESPDEIIRGLGCVLEVFPNAQGVIAIENNKPEAIATMTEHNMNPKIRIMPHKVKYPQGAEKMLIFSVAGREVPLVPALPADIGCIVLNTRTTWQICKAIEEGKPLTERIVSVTGDAVVDPKNLLVPLGLSTRELINACGGFKDEPLKVISGGPMMGIAMRNLDVPVVKGTSGVLALTSKTAYIAEESACIRCGKCVEVCPMHLVPSRMDHAVRRRDYAES